ncbi:OmpA family protein [Lysobacter arvi]|uniref:OmpA family protein n=1 Tax=Lysobacter arvi TaxID=3038776 RepID=A0ABU1CIC0_9GAMM|nr:OmpA family protein [Lysobacter arvi]MDR0184689.1 OmpA family protein [Lysobacter arvi]
MFNFKPLPGFVLALAAGTLLSACGTSTLSQVRDGHTDQPVWPQPEKANPLEPSKVHVDLEALRKVQLGASKLEIYRLIGHPMYREGIAGVHEWDYLFKFATADGEVQCQYKVLFDDDMHASQTLWNPAGCADVLGGAPAEPVAPAPAAAPYVAEAFEVEADALFDFDSAVLSEQGAAALQSRIMTALDKAERVEALRVIGYTDRFGDENYNQALSERRAQAVKAYLVARGVPGEAIMAKGRGEADPVVQCPGAKSAKVIACLKPNRRVRIEVVAR